MKINEIRAIAKIFLNFKPITDEKFPFIIHHPFFRNPHIFINNELVNLEDRYDDIIEEYSKMIDEADFNKLLILIDKAYHLVFLKYIKDYLTIDEFSEYLAYMWVNSENPNQDANVSTKELAEWFKECNKEKLMTTEDYKYYQQLPNKIKIYRGVAVGRNPYGLSYTDNKEKAKWFAHRFDTNNKKGYIIEKTINKKDVLAYFNTRSEKEIVYGGD